MTEWRTKERIEAFEPGRFFFSLVRYTFGRTILLELAKLVDPRESRSIHDFLTKAKTHAAAVGPTKWVTNYDHPSGGTREPVKTTDYVTSVEEDEAILEQHQSVIDNILSRRDKELAHSESKYFDNPELVFEHFPLEDLDIDELLESISEILGKHHIFLKEAGFHMQIQSSRNVDTVLMFNRGFSRVWRDKRLWKECGIRPVDYKKDDYQDPEDRT